MHDGTTLVQPKIFSAWNTGGGGYKKCNAELMAMLLPPGQIKDPALIQVSSTMNPRQNGSFSPKFATSADSPGIGPDYAYRDPWGKPYIVTVDLNGDNVCMDPMYGTINASVAIWSMGPDGRAGGDLENKDNVLSWK